CPSSPRSKMGSTPGGCSPDGAGAGRAGAGGVGSPPGKLEMVPPSPSCRLRPHVRAVLRRDPPHPAGRHPRPRAGASAEGRADRGQGDARSAADHRRLARDPGGRDLPRRGRGAPARRPVRAGEGGRAGPPLAPPRRARPPARRRDGEAGEGDREGGGTHAVNPQGGELRMSFWEHLGELRRRLLRVLLAVLVLGALSLAFSEEIFRFLVQPILAALPEGQRTLIQTSAIEELNTFIKVGVYAGVFLAVPVLLHQIWGFVAPGLYAHERRMAVPFILAGSAAFLAGAVFCYTVVLPPAFRFLLEPEGIRDRQAELALAHGALEDAGFLLRAGEPAAAARLLAGAEPVLERAPAASEDRQTLLARIDRLAPVFDAVDRAVARTGGGRDALAEAILARNEARAHALEGQVGRAAAALDRAVERAAHAYARAVGG